MASAASPGGTLLRASRIFSIPSPIPRTAPYISKGKIFESESMTLPFPTQLSISVPASSIRNGDWGFKRPLPKKTRRSARPIINVGRIDTMEQTTDWSNAKAYTAALGKWQEMDIAMMRPPPGNEPGVPLNRTNYRPQSVFEETFDPIASKAKPDDGWRQNGPFKADKMEAQDSPVAANVPADNRWRFTGPWVAGQTEAEFQAFLNTEVRNRKSEFRAYLREQCAAALRRDMRGSSRGNVQMRHADQHTAANITEAQFLEYLKNIRSDKADLYNKIRTFFDFPPSDAFRDDIFSQAPGIAHTNRPESISNSPYAKTGPPKTHPSAGLYYTRSSSHMSNHHVFGPQEYPAPVRARVVQPRDAKGSQQPPRLGVGGFVTTMAGTTAFRTKRGTMGMLDIEPDAPGGPKAWVRPVGADVQTDGKVSVRVDAASDNAIEAMTGKTLDRPAFRHAERAVGFKRNEASMLDLLEQPNGYGLS